MVAYNATMKTWPLAQQLLEEMSFRGRDWRGESERWLSFCVTVCVCVFLGMCKHVQFTFEHWGAKTGDLHRFVVDLEWWSGPAPDVP